ncbi:Ff.00g026850.m01.CDS01 [Fusarium sp. VM40]|nr:Ff.00g026850.m01.CDS01 [Fusarium sp. VM40]
MTPQEKLECPMLRCRKRFANHELMLQHLYSCSWLSASEYWCYECGKSERFNDSKCKRCLGHPSRRKKILSMAKSFFNSLGHKAKNSTPLQDLDLDFDLSDSEAPPSYDLVVAPHELELQSNEIHEIGSSGIALHSILERENENEAETNPAPISISMDMDMDMDMAVPIPMPTPFMSSLPTNNQNLPARPAELESGAALSEPLDSMLPPGTVAPVNLVDPGCNTTSERPALQLYTTGLEEYRREQKRRSTGQVAPSTSVRSTASTNSTSSTNTTDTTFSRESYNISPISTFSDQWASVPVFDSSFTSPGNDFGSPGGLLRTNSFAISHKAPAAKGWDSFDNEAGLPYDSHPAELPTDLPMLGALPADDSLRDSLVLNQPIFTLNDSPLPADFDLDSNLALTNNNATMPQSTSSALPQPMVGSYHNPRTVIGTAWSTLQMHVADSMNKLHQMNKNHLVSQLRALSTQTISENGLQTLVDLVEGRHPTIPIKVLCFVHFAYCFSLIIHERDAANRSADLFGQAMSYSTLFSRQERQLYIQIVDTLWKPAAMTKADVVSLVRAKTSSSMSRTSSLKGKEQESSDLSKSDTDSLAFLSKYFLDQLEYAVINVVEDGEIQSSNLYMEHLHAPSMETHGDSSQAIAINTMLKHNFQHYVRYPSFAASLDGLVHRVNSGYMSFRRLELELMESGKLCLPPDVYFDSYVSHVRDQMDSLCYANVLGGNPRPTYYRHSVELINMIIGATLRLPSVQSVQGTGAPVNSVHNELDELDEFFNAMTPNPFNFGQPDPFDAGQPVNVTGLPATIDPYILNPPPLPTPADTSSVREPSTAASSPPSSAPATSLSSAAKIKSNSSCKLCGYTPEGDPRWFNGSMAKHIKLQHSQNPPAIYRCEYPGCTSQYKNRPDNLRQHMIEKGHFLEGQDIKLRSSKRRKIE